MTQSLAHQEQPSAVAHISHQGGTSLHSVEEPFCLDISVGFCHTYLADLTLFVKKSELFEISDMITFRMSQGHVLRVITPNAFELEEHISAHMPKRPLEEKDFNQYTVHMDKKSADLVSVFDDYSSTSYAQYERRRAQDAAVSSLRRRKDDFLSSTLKASDMASTPEADDSSFQEIVHV